MLNVRVVSPLVAVGFWCATASAQPAATGEVHGTVKLKDTGAPAAGAVVSLWTNADQPKFPPVGQEGEYVIGPEVGQQHPWAATAGADGSFTIGEVTPGQYGLTVHMDGYVAQDPRFFYVDTRAQMLKVAAGERRGVQVELEHGGVIEGQVGGVANAALSLQVQVGAAGFARYGGSAHADPAGHYRMDGLPAGHYRVFAAFQRSSTEAGPIWFAPGIVRPSRARVMEVRDGQTISSVDFVVPTEGLHVASGVVADTAGKSVTKGFVRLLAAGETEVLASVKPGADGKFSFSGLPDEKYSVCFESEAEFEVRGMTEDGQGLRMFQHKPPYKPVCREIAVSGADVFGVALEAMPN